MFENNNLSNNSATNISSESHNFNQDIKQLVERQGLVILVITNYELLIDLTLFINSRISYVNSVYQK